LLVADKARRTQIFINGHPGIYSGVLGALEPKPDYAILGVAGQPCIDGHAYSGTTASFIKRCMDDLAWPKKVSWALHDPQLLEPKSVDTSAIDKMIDADAAGRTTVLDLTHGNETAIFS
jgi:hypothetical protein